MVNIIAVNTNSGYTLADNDRIYVPRSVVVADPNAYAISSDTGANGHEVVVDGAVVSLALNAIVLRQDAGGLGAHTLVVGETGSVRSLNYGGNSAIYMLGRNSFLQNWGEVTGTWGSFLQDWDNGTVDNHGLMSGTLQAGLFLINAAEVQVINTGMISGKHGIEISNVSMTLLNSGSIHANSAAGTAIHALVASDAVTIRNSGTISAAGTVVETGSFDDTLANSGAILGNVILGAGGDTYNGTGGTVDGQVQGGDGDDILRGGDGDDDLQGEAGRDTLRGRGGEDTLGGGAGNDTLRGGSDDDTQSGDSGADQLYGQSGDDILNAGVGKDKLWGGRGEDILRGSAGNDRLNGGQDDDLLQGDAGADIFVFGRNAGDDTITDFVDGTDRIDLSAYGLRPLDFAAIVAPALSNAGGATFLDLAQLGGQGSVLIVGLAFGNADAPDFIL